MSGNKCTTVDIVYDGRGGESIIREWDSKMTEAIQATMATGKASHVTFKLTIKPDKNDDAIVTLDSDITSKVPRRPHPTSVYFVDEHFRLTREDPKQLELLREQEEEREREREARLEQMQAGGIRQLRDGTND